jgi:putative ABC transport system permease protein
MINGLGVGLNEQAGSALRNFDADAIAYSSEAGLSVIRSELGGELVTRISEQQGVTAAAPIGYVAANYEDADGNVDSAAFLGFDPGTIGAPDVTAGRPLTSDDTYGLLADKSFLRLSGLNVGDTLLVALRLEKQEFTIVGEIDEGAFFFQPAVYLLRTTWQQLKYGTVAQGERPDASIVLLQGKDLFGQFDGYEVVSKSTAFANIEGVQGQQSTVQALRFFGYLIGALVIGVFFYVLTLQKVAQIGVLKAVGASSGFVLRQILIQVVVISIVGIAISVPLAWATDRALRQLPTTVPIAFDAGTFITTSIILLVTALVGGLFSARQVVRVDPIIALGQQQ